MSQNETAGGLTVNRQTLRDGLALVRDTGKAGGDGLAITGRNLVASDGGNVVSVELRGGRGEVSASVPAVVLSQWAAVGDPGDRITIEHHESDAAGMKSVSFTVDAMHAGGGPKSATVFPPTSAVSRNAAAAPMANETDRIEASVELRAERWAEVLKYGGQCGAANPCQEHGIGWQLEIEAGNVRIVSTDRSALATAEIAALPLSVTMGGNARIVAGLSAETVKLLTGMVRGVAGTVLLATFRRGADRLLRVEVTPSEGKSTIGKRVAVVNLRSEIAEDDTTAPSEGPIPEEWRTLVPESALGYERESARSFKVNRADMAQALGSIRIFGSIKFAELAIQDGSLRASARLPDSGGAEIGGTVPVANVRGEWSGSVRITTAYLAKAIKNETAPVLAFHCHGESTDDPDTTSGQWAVVPESVAVQRVTVGVLNHRSAPRVPVAKVENQNEPMEAAA